MTQPDPFAQAIWAIHDAEKAARRNRTQLTSIPTGPAAAPTDGPVQIGDPVKYALGALERAVTELTSTGQGGRNHALNAAAFSLGRLVAAQLLTEQQVTDTLLDACATNGLLAEDGRYTCEGTIRSGLGGGMAQPLRWEQGPPTTVPTAAPFTVAIPEEQPAPEERTTWWPKDLAPIIRGDVDPEPPPAFLYRHDQLALFYAGKVNGLIGESESGKTWVALIAVAQALRDGKRVLYLDFEDTATGIIGRLRALGITDEQLTRLAYISPDETLHPAASRDLGETVALAAPSLVIVDGYNAAMTLLGLELTSNTDVTAFSLRVLRPLKNTGAAVVTIDHVTKSKEGRGSYAIGAQAKRADVDGCLIMVDVVQPFGRGNTGRLKLTVSKDRPGHVRAISGGAKRAGEAILKSHPDTGNIDATIEAPDLRPVEERGEFRPTHLMQRVSEFVEAQAEPILKSAIKGNVRGNLQHAFKAWDFLLAEGYLKVAVAGRVVSERPYREVEDPSSDKYATPVVPDRFPGWEDEGSSVPEGSYAGSSQVPGPRPPSGSSVPPVSRTGNREPEGEPDETETRERYR